MIFSIECRKYGAGERWFVVLDNGRELCPCFDRRDTALEIGWKYTQGERFFNNIPTVPHGFPYPRPDPC